jgi:hypothetical protein
MKRRFEMFAKIGASSNIVIRLKKGKADDDRSGPREPLIGHQSDPR